MHINQKKARVDVLTSDKLDVVSVLEDGPHLLVLPTLYPPCLSNLLLTNKINMLRQGPGLYYKR